MNRVFHRAWLAALLLSVSFNTGATSLDQAVAQVRQQTGGRVVSAETVRREGGVIHQIRVLTSDGRVRLFQIDAGGAATGKGRR